MSVVEFMGTQMTARCAMVIRHVINGLSYAEIAEQTGFERIYIKNSVAQCRMKGLDIPRAPRSTQKPRPKSVSQSTVKMIEMAKSGMTTEEIAKKVGISKKRVSGLLSYHRTKGEDLPIRTLPLDEYEALHKQGLSQHRIAQELGIGKMKASSCVRSLVEHGRIDGNNMRNPCSKKPAGKDLWAMALGRKELY